MSDSEHDLLSDSPTEKRRRLKKKSEVPTKKPDEEDEAEISLPSSSSESDDERSDVGGADDGNAGEGAEKTMSDVGRGDPKTTKENGRNAARIKKSLDGAGANNNNGMDDDEDTVHSESEADEKYEDDDDDEEDEQEASVTASARKRSRTEEYAKGRPRKRRRATVKTTKRRKRKRSKRDSDDDDDSVEFKEGHELDEEVALLTTRAGFSPLEMLPSEKAFFPNYAEGESRYLDIRNLLVYKWKSDPTNFLSLEKAKDGIQDEFLDEIEPVWDFLTRHGYINVGIFKNWEAKRVTFPDGDQPRVVVIGSGAAGLGCAQQLHQWGYKVTVIEARRRLGGRCCTSDDLDSLVDLGASIITGLIRNPLDNLHKQLGIRTHAIGTASLMRTISGKEIDSKVDLRMDQLFNNLLERVASTKDPTVGDKSLGREMEKILPKLAPLESGILDWYYANLEYACAADLSELSSLHWDQDDPYDFSGDHLILVDGYGSMIKPLANNLDVRLGHVVKTVNYGLPNIVVECENGQKFECDVAVVTVPLGVLKADLIKFNPPLPNWKREAISSLGFGLLNKVAMLFDEVFWDKDKDWFGKVSTDQNRASRGLYYLWWNYHKVLGEPILVALVAGRAGHLIEERTDSDIIDEVKDVLKSMFGLPEQPKVVKYAVTRWKKDKFAGGSYSYVALGASGEDYDALCRTVVVGGKNKLFFGGEHTCRQYPATVAGAYASGLREAEKVHRTFLPPIRSTFRLPRQTEAELKREHNREELVKQSHGGVKSRTRAAYRRGIRSRGTGTDDDDGKKSLPLHILRNQSTFQYRPLFSKNSGTNDNTPRKDLRSSGRDGSPRATQSTQYRKYDALLVKKRKPEEREEFWRNRRPVKVYKREPSPEQSKKPEPPPTATTGNSSSLSGYHHQNVHQSFSQPPASFQYPASFTNAFAQAPTFPIVGGLSVPLSGSGGPRLPPNPNGTFTGGLLKVPEVSHHRDSHENGTSSSNRTDKRERRDRSSKDKSHKDRRKSSRKPDDANLSEETKKARSKFREETAKVIVNRLSRYHKQGKIKSDDFKSTSRKLTHKVVDHEEKNMGNYVMDDKKKTKMKKLVDDYIKRKKPDSSKKRRSSHSKTSSRTKT